MIDETRPSTGTDPVVALRRAAYLLERGRESTYRVKAFRGAAAALAALPADEVARRAQEGTLTAVRGVGERTAAVAADAVAGRTSEYLAGLEERFAGPLAPDGLDVLALLRGDLHAHTNWSDGGSPVADMAAAAAGLGREYQAITDHSPRLRVANGLTAERLRAQLDEVAAVQTDCPDGFTLLTGIEVDILDDGSLDQDPDLLGCLDVVVASAHSKLAMAHDPMTERLLAAVRDPHTDVLGHCTGRLVGSGRGSRAPSTFDATAVFAQCAASGVAVEINARPERCDPPGDLLALAVDAGCLFAVDSDAHAPGQLGLLEHGAARVARLGIPVDRIVTTWPLADLRAWLERGR